MKQSEIMRNIQNLHGVRFPRLIRFLIQVALRGHDHVEVHRIKFEELVRWDEWDIKDMTPVDYMREAGFKIEYGRNGYYVISWD